MPNWCEGTLRIRGKIADLRRFCDEALNPVTILGEASPDGKQLISADEQGFCYTLKDSSHLGGTHRGFIESDFAEVYANKRDDVTVLLLDYKEAWNINAKPLADLCTKYQLDMRIHAFERGMQFERIIEIIGGEIKRDDTIDYEGADWDWECSCPSMGG